MEEYAQAIVILGNALVVYLIPEKIISEADYYSLITHECQCEEDDDGPYCNWCDDITVFNEKEWIDRPGVIKMSYPMDRRDAIPPGIRINRIFTFEELRSA